MTEVSPCASFLPSFASPSLVAALLLSLLTASPVLASGPVVGWPVPPMINAEAIAAGVNHSCAIQAGTGAVVCWGDDYWGESTPPPSVDGTTGTATAVAAGGLHSCAIQAGTGAVVCWGRNSSGQATPPPSVDGTEGAATAIAAGGSYTLAIRTPERSDGLDNDGYGRIDFDPVTHANPDDETTLPAGSGDSGCFNPFYFTESPKCQDGAHNDGDGKMDYDAGLSANGFADPAGPDSYCVGSPWVNLEAFPTCGLGADLALLLPPLMWMWRRRSLR